MFKNNRMKTQYIKTMNNWKCLYIIFFAFVFLSAYGQNEKSQMLLNLLNEGRYFESKELYQEIHNTLDYDEDLYYKYRMHLFMNRKDSVAFCLEQLLEYYPEFIGNQAINIYAELFILYTDLVNRQQGMRIYELMKEHLDDNPYDINERELGLWRNFVTERFAYFNQVINGPLITLKRKEMGDSLKIESGERLRFNAKFNGIVHKAIFDTGLGCYCTMSRGYAEKMGINCDAHNMIQKPFNGTDMQVYQVIMDSIEIGNVILYNIPILLLEHDISQYLPDSIKNDSIKMEHFDSVMNDVAGPIIGFPVMQLIGKVLIDYGNNTISFPSLDINHETLKEPNIFFYGGDIYTQIKLNERGFIGTLDTGCDGYITIDSVFYDKNKNDIPIDTISVKTPFNFAMLHRTWVDIPYEIPEKPIITFNNKNVFVPTEKDNPIRIFSMQPIWPMKIFDGVIGYDFFKRIGKKVLLDLDNMRLEAIE